MAPRQQHTLTDIQGYLQNRLQSSPFWNNSELTTLINEGIRTWNCLTGQWKRRVPITTVRGNPYYQLPANLVFGMHLEFNGQPITQGSVAGWDRGSPDWESQPSVPQEWAPVDLLTIAIRPADAVGRNSLAVDGVSAAPVLVGGGDFIDMSEDDYSAYIGYLQYLAAFKEGGAEFENAQPLHVAFLKQAAIRNEKLLASAIFRRAMGLDEKGVRPRFTRSQLNPVGVR